LTPRHPGRARHLGPWDVGLQPERTALAWRRTALSIGVLSAALARLLVQYSSAAAIVLLAVEIPLVVLIALAAQRRLRRVDSWLRTGTPLRPGLLHLGMTVLACCFGLAAISYSLLRS
jgi:putative membrane protein